MRARLGLNFQAIPPDIRHDAPGGAGHAAGMDSKPFEIQRLTGELVEAFDLGDEEEAKRIAARYLVALGGLAPNRRAADSA